MALRRHNTEELTPVRRRVEEQEPSVRDKMGGVESIWLIFTHVLVEGIGLA